MGGGPMMLGGGKPKNFKTAFSTLMKYLSKYKISIIIVFIFAIGSTVFSIVGPKILGTATTEIFNGIVAKVTGKGGINFAAIGNTLLTLLFFYILSAVLSFVQGFVMSGVTQKLSFNFRRLLSEKIARLPMGYFDRTTHGEVLSRITNDVDTLSQSLNQSLTQVITSTCTIIGIFVMMLSISWQMTLIALLTLPLSFGFMRLVVKKSQNYFSSQQATLGVINGQVEETFGGINIVKAFNREDETLAEFDEKNKKLYSSAWKSQFLSGLMMPVMNFIGNLGYVGVCIFGGYLAIRGTIQIGDIQSFIQYTRSFTQPITQVAQVSNLMQSTMAAAERVFEFLDEPEEAPSPENPVSTKGLVGNVTFEHVKFGYSEDKIVINDFCADVKDGQKIAIVGPTGAGKTTIVKLLMHFYELNGGRILVDGHDIKDFDRGELRRMFGMVLQDTWLFGGTIMENIRYGKQTASDEDVINAAKAAHVHHFIKTLPDGYNMVLNEEASNISGGQKQLLTIARAILANPEILILDEATSSVDTRTEQRIQTAMDTLMKGRTSFIIAHRLSTIKNADIILVLNEGDVVEQGSHDELIKKGGFYSELYNSQFENAG